MNGADKDYKFGQKNNWRRRVWNEIARRVADRRNALVLYLAGEQDLDRKVAVEHGFRPNNMIIVEKDKRVAACLRAEGKVVLNMSLNDALYAWPNESPEVAVVYADLCCGLQPDVGALDDVMGEKPSFFGAVALVNMLRGRDAASNDARQVGARFLPDEWQKHRGCLMLVLEALTMLSVNKYGNEYTYGTKTPWLDSSRELVPLHLGPFDAKDMHMFGQLWKTLCVLPLSYNSGKNIMDSIVYQGVFSKDPALAREIFKKQSAARTWPTDDSMRHQIRAALAVRTMRTSGRLAHAPSI